MTTEEFEQFWKCCGDDIYRFCLHIAFKRDRADDLYQETALTAFRKSEEIQAGSNPKAYIFSIAVKLSHNAFRKSKRRGEDTAVPIDEEPHKADGVCVEREAENEELKRAVRRAVASLDEKLRVPLTLYYFDERGIEFISEVMNIPQGTVKSRLHKARSVVRRRLSEGGYTYE